MTQQAWAGAEGMRILGEPLVFSSVECWVLMAVEDDIETATKERYSSGNSKDGYAKSSCFPPGSSCIEPLTLEADLPSFNPTLLRNTLVDHPLKSSQVPSQG